MNRLKYILIGTLFSSAIAFGLAEWNAIDFKKATTFSALTASTVPQLSASKVLESSNISTTEFDFLNNVSSNIQTQLDAKIAKSTGTAKGDLLCYSTSGTVTNLAVGANDTVLTADSGQTCGVKWASASASTANLTNYAQNGEFRFWQRQTPGTLANRQDDAYGPDRWYILTSGGAVNVGVARVAEEISGSPSQYVAQVRQEDSTNRRYGIFQILEKSRVVELEGKAVALSFYARTDGTEITTLRACIGEWDGTADSVTSDVVSSWAATPTWIANFECINTPADLTISSSWAQLTVTGTLETDFNNLVIGIWTPNEEAENDDFYITQVQWVQGSSALTWDKIALPFSIEMYEMFRFFFKSYDLDTPPASATRQSSFTADADATVGSHHFEFIRFPMQMRASPSVTLYNPSTGSTTDPIDTDGTDVSASVYGAWPRAVGMHATGNLNAGGTYYFHLTAEAEL